MVAVLKYSGFSLNQEKTFSGSDRFRESCGGDYFDGHDVRPYYIKESVNDPWLLIPTYNGFRKSLGKLEAFRGRSSAQVLHPLLDSFPSVVRSCKGPEQLGDTVLHSICEDEWRFKWEYGIRYFKGVVRVNKPLAWHHWHPNVVLASALYGAGDGSFGIIPRDSPFSMAVKWVPSS